ncbi:MAG: TonB-dependent receptor [Flavobacteriia bacterium]|nr:TonB-dependent receptor [Flavobacteriia bacterium]
MKKILFITLMTFLHFISAGAEIFGEVKNKNKGIEFAKIVLKKNNKIITGAWSNINGKYFLTKVEPGKYQVFVTAENYFPDSIQINILSDEKKEINFSLIEKSQNLDEVVVSGTLKETFISESTVTIDVITPKLFQKNPTSNIFDALSMVNGVRPQMQCNVCSTGDIHINGMEGPYTMVMIDGMPIVSALGSVYGLMGIPNSIIQRVEIQKGPASTLYGSEAVGGLINVITKSPINAPIFSIDFFGTAYQEYNTDVSVKYKISKKLSGLFSSNVYWFDKKWDTNNDNFTDITIQKRVAGFNKFTFTHNNGKSSHLALRYYYEDRWGGEMNWTEKFRGSDSIYGESIYTNRLEVIGKSPFKILKSPFEFQYSYNHHKQNSAYGTTPFHADQKIAFGQIIKNITLNRHDILFGIANRYVYYDDNTVITAVSIDSVFHNKPTITVLPGIFIQDEWNFSERQTLLVGIRCDEHKNHGCILSPRLNYKFKINEKHTIRLGVGNGYRVVNLFSEDHAAFNGAREVVITEELKPEQSWNVNLNYSLFGTHKKGFFSLESNIFYTYFSNKIVADYFTDHNKVIFSNLNGYGINRGFGVQSHFSFDFPLKIAVGFTYVDLFIKDEDTLGNLYLRRQVQTPPFSGNFVFSYKINKWQLSFDLSGNVYSPMLLPVLPNDYRPDHSPWFSLINLQINKEWKDHYQCFIGIKNILNFIPKNPIMRPFDPFDKNVNDPVSNPYNYTFDPGYNYAPIQGIRFFAGFRIKF